MWRFLRWLYFGALWLGALMAGGLTFFLWHRFPFKILGVGWNWFAGAGVVALALVALDATMEISATPLPPDVPPNHEVSQWLLFLIAGAATAFIFAVDTGVLFVVTHALFRWALPHLPFWIGKPLLAAAWLGWFVGTIYALRFLADASIGFRFRTFLRYRLLNMHTGAADVRCLLERSDLPPDAKQRFLARLDSEGLTPALAHDLLKVAGKDPWEAAESHRNTATTLLVQTLNNWEEERIARG